MDIRSLVASDAHESDAESAGTGSGVASSSATSFPSTTCSASAQVESAAPAVESGFDLRSIVGGDADDEIEDLVDLQNLCYETFRKKSKN